LAVSVLIFSFLAPQLDSAQTDPNVDRQTADKGGVGSINIGGDYLNFLILFAPFALADQVGDRIGAASSCTVSIQ
jgi:hypothetical protein